MYITFLILRSSSQYNAIDNYKYNSNRVGLHVVAGGRANLVACRSKIHSAVGVYPSAIAVAAIVMNMAFGLASRSSRIMLQFGN